MANNRMYLSCQKCDPSPETWVVGNKGRIYLGKYYPSTGWYYNHVAYGPLDEHLQEWLEEHSHEASSWGNEHIKFHYEIPLE